MARNGPPNPARLNAAIGAQNYGIKLAPVVSISFGIEQRSQEAHSRQKQTMYAQQVLDPSFVIGMTFTDQPEYHDMFEWFRAYGYLVTATDSIVGPMRVLVPSRNFDKIGVPTSGMTFGDDVSAVTFKLNIVFEGTSDPVTTDSGSLSPYWSQFVLPGKAADQSAPYFYPGGVQLSGQYADEDSLYNLPSPDVDVNLWTGKPLDFSTDSGGNGGRRLK